MPLGNSSLDRNTFQNDTLDIRYPSIRACSNPILGSESGGLDKSTQTVGKMTRVTSGYACCYDYLPLSHYMSEALHIH